MRQLFPKMASNEIEEGSTTQRGIPEETDYNSVSDVPVSVIKLQRRGSNSCCGWKADECSSVE